MAMIFFLVPYSLNLIFAFKNKSRKNVAISENKIVNENKNVVDDIQIEKNNSESINQIIPEDYIKGVVAAEMPVSFEIEALKAQAVAARTYAIKHYDGTDLKNLYQAYISVDDMKKNWGNNFEKNYKKISDAVNSTKGETIKYNNEMIEAVFHSTSAGFTENSENVWKTPLPYLKSVDSHEDEQAPNFQVEKKISLTEVVQKINNKYGTSINEKNFMDEFIIGQRTNAGYIKNIKVCGKNIDALEIRMLLGLRSTNFTIKKDGSDIIFTTKGFGHGAGMSQYGANFMAKQGYDYKQILKHYYSGVEVE